MKVFTTYGGEFGWEVTSYYPMICWLSVNSYEVELQTFDTATFLYKDLPRVNVSSHNLPSRGNFCKSAAPPKIPILKPEDKVLILDDKRSTFNNCGKYLREIRPDCKPKDVGKHVVVHARQFTQAGDAKLKKTKAGRNWNNEYTEALELLMHKGFDIYFVGDPKYSKAFTGLGDDIRGIPMEEQLSIWKSAKLLIGPSSGAMCLSQWIGVPIFSWGDNSLRTEVGRNNKTEVWNPFMVPSYHPWSKTKTPEQLRRCMNQQCAPTSDELKEGIEFMLEDLRWDRSEFEKNIENTPQ